jgi:hypothetical protein
MVRRMAQALCRHPGCTCTARSDGYCSTACASQKDGADQPCLCGHDECEPPSKFESKAAFADIAPEGRIIGNYSRDW